MTKLWVWTRFFVISYTNKTLIFVDFFHSWLQLAVCLHNLRSYNKFRLNLFVNLLSWDNKFLKTHYFSRKVGRQKTGFVGFAPLNPALILPTSLELKPFLFVQTKDEKVIQTHQIRLLTRRVKHFCAVQPDWEKSPQLLLIFVQNTRSPTSRAASHLQIPPCPTSRG